MIHKLANAIGYPEEVSSGVVAFTFRVDDGAYIAEIIGSRLVMKRVLDIAEEDLLRLIEFVAGRLLREEAVLAWDDRLEQAFLWQEMPINGSTVEIQNAFETFVESCEWWFARVAEMRVPPTVFPDIMIRP